MKCPHCGRELVLFDEVLNLWQCPKDFEVYEYTKPSEMPSTLTQTN